MFRVARDHRHIQTTASLTWRGDMLTVRASNTHLPHAVLQEVELRLSGVVVSLIRVPEQGRGILKVGDPKRVSAVDEIVQDTKDSDIAVICGKFTKRRFPEVGLGDAG